jgi:FkbM family methyltransferase
MIKNNILKTVVKNCLWKLFSDSDGLKNVTILTGPCKGVKLRIDFRNESAYWLGSYDRKILKLICDILKQGAVAFDCGTYLGYYGAAMRKAVGETGKVYLFEASTVNFNRVSALPANNKWLNVEVFNLAIGQHHSVIRFATNLGAASGPVDMPGKNLDLQNVEIEEVKCCGIDELVYEMGLPAPDFIKLDIETGECYALVNGKKLWENKRPVLLVELHRDKKNRPYAFEAAEKFLKDFNYLGKEVHLGISVKTVDDFIKAEELGVQCTILATPQL